MNEKKYKQLQAGLLIATIIVWGMFGYLYLEGTWKEELYEQKNMTDFRSTEVDWDNITFPYQYYDSLNLTESENDWEEEKKIISEKLPLS